MNKFLKISILSIFVMVASQSYGQTYKFGHLDLQEVVTLMPDSDSVSAKLKNYAEDMEETLTGMQNEFTTKMTAYQQKSATWTASILEAKQRELQEMEQRIGQFNQNAQEEFGALQRSLFAPVYQKAMDALTKVGKENGFTYIYDMSTRALPYFNEATSVDVDPLMRKALNIPADKKLPIQQPMQ